MIKNHNDMNLLRGIGVNKDREYMKTIKFVNEISKFVDDTTLN